MRALGQVVRGLLRSPAHSAVVVLTLALGIGVSVAIESVVQGVLLTPLPFPDPERLVVLWQRAPGVGVAEDWFSPAQYFDIRVQVTSFEESAIVIGGEVTLTGDAAEPERVGALSCSSSLFALLGIEPVLGRALRPEDDALGSARKVLLSRRLFDRRFGSDPGVLRRSIEVDGERLQVVGVLPPLPLDGEVLPTLDTVPVFDLVTSLPLEDPQRTPRGSENYNVLARLTPRATIERAREELLGVAEGVVKDPESLGAGLVPGPEYRIDAVALLDQVVGRVRTPLLLLLGATFVLLLIACANVANLVMTRAASRHRELALRTALGATRAQRIAHSILPSTILGLVSGALGLVIALVVVSALERVAPPDLPRLAGVTVDGTVVLYAAGLSLVVTVLFGLGPALRTSSISPIDALRGGAAAARARSFGKSGARPLVVAQVALSLVLTMVAALLLRTLWHLQAVDPGFRPEGVLTFRVSLAGERYRDRESRGRFYRDLFARLGELPGSAASGGISMLPLTRGFAWTDFTAEGHQSFGERDRVVADVHVVTPGYFQAMGVRLLSGRAFGNEDRDGPSTVVVDRALAERLWTVDTAVGKWVSREPETRATIVGVVESVKHYGLAAESHPTVFLPYREVPSRTLYGVVRGSTDLETLASGISASVRSLDPQLPVYDVRSMTDRLHDSLLREQVLVALLALFGAVALLLATVGLYAVLSFTVATHSRELGIRKAVGANPRDLYRLVLRGAVGLLGLGTVLGLGIALVAGRWVQGLLFEVGPSDPLSFVLSGALVLLVGLAASLLPARRAAGVDPMTALKEE
jgi:putative ABC transport system permease protein